MPSVAQSARVKLVKEFDCAYNFAGGAVTLHARRGKQDMHGAGASRDHVQDVANRGAVWRSDHAYAARKHRNRSLQFSAEQTFCLQPRLGLLEGELQSARADRLEGF